MVMILDDVMRQHINVKYVPGRNEITLIDGRYKWIGRINLIEAIKNGMSKVVADQKNNSKNPISLGMFFSMILMS